MPSVYRPEGLRIDLPENAEAMGSVSALKEAGTAGKILEARAVLCDSQHNLWVDLGCCRGIIPRLETVLGIDDGSTRDIAIISRVNKPVCFVVTGITQDADGNPRAV